MSKFNFRRAAALLMGSAMLACSLLSAASAANVATATIDTSHAVSLTLYKYDMTSAAADSAWTSESYVSSGLYDASVNQALKDYAIEGVEFSYLKVADITTHTATESDRTNRTQVLYEFSTGDETESLLADLNLSDSDAYKADTDSLYFESDTLIDALEDSLTANATALKTALEKHVASNGGTAMPETDENGYSKVTGLDQGLYLVVETRVPENVTSTTAPFLISLPTTTIDGDEWNYDVTVYPKNETGTPNLEKTVREASADTGKNDGSTTDISDGYAHTATGSDGDVMEYQIISTLPTITSPATALTTYTYRDVLCKGIRYDGEENGSKNVRIEFFKDADCTDKITTWTEADGKFNVEYSDYDASAGSTMTITMTEDGLKEINSASTVYDSNTSLLRGYSNCTMRITYSAEVNSDADTVYGDTGNPNEVTLTWKRTNTDYYDTLKDDCHVYTYGLDLTKKFSDDNGDFSEVQFLMKNNTDGYYLQAECNADEGVYYVTGHTANESEATKLVPMSGDKNKGKVIVKGLEDDQYVITELATDDGYTLLKDAITMEITSAESETVCEVCGKALLTASAKVNGNAVDMEEDNSSVHASVPLTVTNTRNFTLPKTGENGELYLTIGGIALLLIAVGIGTVYVHRRKHA